MSEWKLIENQVIKPNIDYRVRNISGKEALCTTVWPCGFCVLCGPIIDDEGTIVDPDPKFPSKFAEEERT